jgi:hypothetical protein
LLAKDILLPAGEDLVDEGVHVEEGEYLVCRLLAILEDKVVKGFRNVSDSDEDKLNTAGQNGNKELYSPESLILPLLQRTIVGNAEAISEDDAQSERS